MIIGVDPHKTSHTATATNAATNTAVGSLRVDASVAGYRQLLRWARQFGERQWAVENARGLGCHLSQWLVAQDEIVNRTGFCRRVVYLTPASGAGVWAGGR